MHDLYSLKKNSDVNLNSLILLSKYHHVIMLTKIIKNYCNNRIYSFINFSAALSSVSSVLAKQNLKTLFSMFL